MKTLRNIGKIFTGDLKQIRNNTIAWIVVMGLTIVPSLYAWFNIAASWDPYGNTGNLKVAVANMDEGYRGSLFPITLNVGDQVEMNLRENNQLNWIFTDEKAAIRGVKSGKYYAAIVLPESFSRDIMSLFSKDRIQRSDILYYLNEKENAIAPKITDKGASAVQKQIDQVFAQTVSEIGLDILDGLTQVLNETDGKETMENFTVNLQELAGELDDSADLVDTFASIVSSLSRVTDSSAEMLDAAVGKAGKAQKDLQQITQTISGLSGAVTGTTEAVNLALRQTKESYQEIAKQADAAMDLLYQDMETGQKVLAELAAKVDQQVQAAEKVKQSLQELRDALPELAGITQDALDRMIRNLQKQIDLQSALRDDLQGAANELYDTEREIEQKRQTLKTEIEENYLAIEELQADYEANVETKILQLIDSFDASGDAVVDLLDQLDAAAAQIDVSTGDLSDNLVKLQAALEDTSGMIRSGAKEIRRVSAKINKAVQNSDTEELDEILGTDPTEVSEFLAAPVKLNNIKYYPVENYGSAMAPFYSVLAIWVGGVVLVAMMKVNVDRKRQEELADVTPAQLYLGRYILFLIIGLLQSGLICLGDLYFLEIQCEHPFCFMLAGWFTSIVFVNLLYTLTVSFGDIGKAICVVLMVIQVAGSGGTFPIEMTPTFFQRLYVLLPFTHGMAAMRECIAGFYGNTYWKELGILSLYLIASLLLGLVLRKPIIRLNDAFNEKLEETKVI